jgi:hypothetical protein
MSETAEPDTDPDYGERCADCPATVIAEPVPVLGPFIGLVAAVLCALAGALLLLAPFAFDYRQGAGSMPRSSVVDLATGGAVLVVGLLTTLLFGGSLRRRLRALVPAAAPEPLSSMPPLPEPGPDLGTVPEQRHSEPEPWREEPRREEARPVPPPAAPAVDPGAALRDLLAPLVAALAADLRARETSVESEGRQS